MYAPVTSVVPTTGFTTPEEPPQEGQWEEALTRVWTVALERVLSVGPSSTEAE